MATKSYQAIRSRMSAKDQATARRKAKKMLAEMPLQELRQARQLSQVQLAESLGTKQAEISKIEKRTDMYLSTMRRYIEAMGGELEIVAHFPDGNVRIEQFRDIDSSPKKRKRSAAG